MSDGAYWQYDEILEEHHLFSGVTKEVTLIGCVYEPSRYNRGYSWAANTTNGVFDNGTSATLKEAKEAVVVAHITRRLERS
jgi:hypothetical protein